MLATDISNIPQESIENLGVREMEAVFKVEDVEGLGVDFLDPSKMKRIDGLTK